MSSPDPFLNDTPDPAEDREEFEIRLKNIFNTYEKNFDRKALKAILMQDSSEMQNMRNKISASETKINDYLSQWDAAPDIESRRRVVGSVRKD